jgi:hypothetical protein
MKRFSGWWQRVPRLCLVKPGELALAEKALEGFQRATEGFQRATEQAKQMAETLQHAVAFVNELQAKLDRAREELITYHASCMEPDAQVAELERMGAKETPEKDVCRPTGVDQSHHCSFVRSNP